MQVAVDDAPRLAYLEVPADNRTTAPTAIMMRARRRIHDHGICAKRALTNTASAYPSGTFAKTPHLLAIRQIFTRPDTPKNQRQGQEVSRHSCTSGPTASRPLIGSPNHRYAATA